MGDHLHDGRPPDLIGIRHDTIRCPSHSGLRFGRWVARSFNSSFMRQFLFGQIADGSTGSSYHTSLCRLGSMLTWFWSNGQRDPVG
jgi:hypothetical protein